MTEQASAKAPAANSGGRKGRSPAYPGIDLQRAIALAAIVYKQDRTHEVAPETVAHHWKLKPLSSQFLTTISALKKFGLMDAMPQRGPHSGKVRISELGRDIIVDEREDSTERDVAIRRAALKPEIHADLWRKYHGELPSDSTLRYTLIRDLKFTEQGAGDFISQFKRTIEFAGLGPSDGVSANNDDKLDPDEGAQGSRMADLMERMEGFPQRQAASKAGQVREVPIPIAAGTWPALKAAFPLTEEAWDQMIAVLNAMKPGLIEPKG